MLNRHRNLTKLKSIRKKLREKSTDAERVLWHRLRNRNFKNCKFYRQYGIGNYILDFYCPEFKLAIELDGGHHTEGEQIELDSYREEFIKSCGVQVLRFWNNEVIHHLSDVLEEIYRCVKRPQFHLPANMRDKDLMN